MKELTGQTFAGCEILGKLGEGGMGAVYKARQTLLDRFVAIKVMAPQLAEDTDFVERFKHEAANAAKLNHANMVLVHTAGESDGLHYIVMEFVEGDTLLDHIAHQGRLEPREAVSIAVYIAQALECAWNKARLIHRDIKPANIFLSRTGDVKVGDLGLAKDVGQSSGGITATGMVMGSPHYISPEQARGGKDIDFRADIYSVGCTLYHMLTGKPPYETGDSLAIIHKHIYDPPPAIFRALPSCPMPLGMLVGKMLAKDRNARPQSYEELIDDLLAIHDELKANEERRKATASKPTVPALSLPKASAPAAKPASIRALEMPVVRKKLSSAIIYSIAGAVGGVLLTGLFLWSPWKTRNDVRTSNVVLAPKLPPAEPKLGDTMVTGTGIELVYIPPGEFMMGSTKEEQAWAMLKGHYEKYARSEGEPRKAKIKQGFWLGRTEVTVGQWKQFVAATGYRTEAERKGFVDSAQRHGQSWGRVDGLSWRDPGFGMPPQDNHPVCCVSWNDATSFCQWLTEREQKAGRLPEGFVGRLPTEAEWEYACRAGTQTRFWWGELEADGRDRARIGGQTVGSEFVALVDHYGARGRNGFGLTDMLGNVGELCLDSYDPNGANEEPYMGSDLRALRGGAYMHAFGNCRCAARTALSSPRSSSNCGFRLAVGPVR